MFKIISAIGLCLSLFLVATKLVNPAVAAQTNYQFDLLIANGRVIDGTGSPWFAGDIAVKDGRIAQIGRIDPKLAREVIDAKGAIVAPGFIDVHAHTEDIAQLPQAENYLRMGVTSVITGNCGISVVKIGDFFKQAEQAHLAINMGSLIGHGAIRTEAMKLDNRPPTEAELQRMKDLVEQAMKDGAVGMSTGLIYVPGTYADTDEVVQLARVVGRYGGIYATHMRDEGNHVVDSVRESIQIGKQADLPVEISHIKISSKAKWGENAAIIKLIDDARAAGQQVTADEYVYTASSTSLDVLLPSWALEGGRAAGSERLKDPATRQKIVDQMKQGLKAADFADYGYAVVAHYRPNPEFDGKSIVEIAQLTKKTTALDDQISQVFEMYAAGGAGMIYHKMSDGDLESFLHQPFVMVAADSGVLRFGSGRPHPRGYGNNATVLATYVRERHLLTLPDAIRKMTSLPAAIFKLWDRGILRPGLAADIVIFDENTVSAPATYDQPHQYAKGFSYVFVNGTAVIRNGEFTKQYPGQILYGPGKQKN